MPKDNFKTVTDYAHKDVMIQFDAERAQFSCSIGVQKFKAPSLDAIKKKIDAALLVEFKPFMAVRGNLDDVAQFQVIGIAKSDGYRRGIQRGTTVFVCVGERGNFELDEVTPATTANIKAVKHASDTWERCREQEKKLEDERNAARHAIPSIRARDYTTLKVKP